MTAVLRERVIPLKCLNGLLGISAQSSVNADDELCCAVGSSGGAEYWAYWWMDFRETLGVIQKPLSGFLSGLSDIPVRLSWGMVQCS